MRDLQRWGGQSSTLWTTGKKMKYQFWNNTGISVVLYWDIIGRLTGIPTLEKWYNYQCWCVKIISQHWETIILIGKSLEVLFCCTNLGILAQFPDLGKYSFCWKTIGIIILFYQHWYIVTISQYWKMLFFTGKLME